MIALLFTIAIILASARILWVIWEADLKRPPRVRRSDFERRGVCLHRRAR